MRIYWTKLGSQNFWLGNIEKFPRIWMLLDIKPTDNFKKLEIWLSHLDHNLTNPLAEAACVKTKIVMDHTCWAEII